MHVWGFVCLMLGVGEILWGTFGMVFMERLRWRDWIDGDGDGKMHTLVL